MVWVGWAEGVLYYCTSLIISGTASSTLGPLGAIQPLFKVAQKVKKCRPSGFPCQLSVAREVWWPPGKIGAVQKFKKSRVFGWDHGGPEQYAIV